VPKGKFAYMAPEQARAGLIDRRADIWAGGVIAWELLTRRRLYDGDNDAAALPSLVNEDAPPLRTVAPSVHRALEQPVARALRRDLETRFPTAAEYANALTVAAREAGVKIA
jgi:serine/threonine-protein kinase